MRIEASIDRGTAYCIIRNGEKVGSLVVKVEGDRGDLELLFTAPNVHSKGIGYAAWCAVEKMYPQVKIWETCTPYFEKSSSTFVVHDLHFGIDWMWKESTGSND